MLLSMHRLSVVGALVLVAGTAACASPPATPSGVPETPAPLPTEPCDGAVLEQALAEIEEVGGYRFTQEIAWPRAPRRVGDDRVWAPTRTHGAFLAPERYKEEVVQTDDPLGSGMGFVRAVRIGGTQWWLVPAGDEGVVEWREVPPDAHGGNVLTVVPLYLQDADVVASLDADAPSLPGEGGCVMTARAGGPQLPGVVAVRIDPTVPMVVAFAVEHDEMRWRMEVTYEVPAADEFVAPIDVAPDS